MCVYIYKIIYKYIILYIHIYMYIYVYICIYINIYISIHIYIYIYIYSGQLSIWNRKTLAQNEYHIYRQILLHTHDYLIN